MYKCTLLKKLPPWQKLKKIAEFCAAQHGLYTLHLLPMPTRNKQSWCLSILNNVKQVTFLLSQVGYINFSPFYHNPELPVKRVINSSLQVVTILTSNDTLAEASDEYPVCLPELHITSPAWCDLWTFSDDSIHVVVVVVVTFGSFSYDSMVTTCSIVLVTLATLGTWQYRHCDKHGWWRQYPLEHCSFWAFRGQDVPSFCSGKDWSGITCTPGNLLII